LNPSEPPDDHGRQIVARNFREKFHCPRPPVRFSSGADAQTARPERRKVISAPKEQTRLRIYELSLSRQKPVPTDLIVYEI
jgi:hypothetical protein